MNGRLPMALVLSLTTGGLLTAGVAPRGQEIQVNTYTMANQFIPSVARNDAGGHVIVWVSVAQDGSGYGIFGQRFDGAGGRVGAELQVSTYATGPQYRPKASMNGAGGFVVVWQSTQDGSATGVFGQAFESGGARVGSEFQASTYTTGDQYRPGVAIGGSGDFVVVWESDQDGSGAGVFGQLFDSGGGRIGGEFQVNSYTTYSQLNSTVAMEATGEFVVAWISGYQNGSTYAVFGQRFDSAGDPVGGEFQVSTGTTTEQYHPVVAMNESGAFVVAWRESYDGSDTGVSGRAFDSGGVAVGVEFQANSYTTGDQAAPGVAMNASEDFVVVWESRQDGDGAGIFGRSFDSGGSPLGGEFQVNSYTTSYQLSPSIAMSAAGDFVVAWNSFGQDGSGSAVIAQGAVVNGPALTSPVPGGMLDCSDPALIRPTITWDTGDYDQFKVFMGSSPGFETGTRVTSGDQKIVTGSWTPSKKKWKSACKKALTLSPNPNNPEMYVAVGGFDRDSSKSDPLRKLLSFPVRAQVQP